MFIRQGDAIRARFHAALTDPARLAKTPEIRPLKIPDEHSRQQDAA
jgi:hypothetical protein